MPHPSTIVHLDDLGQAEPTAFGFRTEDYPRLDRVQNVISGVCGCIAGVSIVVLCVLTCAEVFMRAAFHSPLGWNVSVTEKYLIPAIAFFGLVTAYRTGSHIAVASLFAKFPAKVRKALLILIHVLVLVVLLVAVVAGWNITMTAVTWVRRFFPGSPMSPPPTGPSGRSSRCPRPWASSSRPSTSTGNLPLRGTCPIPTTTPARKADPCLLSP
jgi:TRAP-type C4-dicarboxylate transport system permease small subunit